MAGGLFVYSKLLCNYFKIKSILFNELNEVLCLLCNACIFVSNLGQALVGSLFSRDFRLIQFFRILQF